MCIRDRIIAWHPKRPEHVVRFQFDAGTPSVVSSVVRIERESARGVDQSAEQLREQDHAADDAWCRGDENGMNGMHELRTRMQQKYAIGLKFRARGLSALQSLGRMKLDRILTISQSLARKLRRGEKKSKPRLRERPREG